jgi:16S rRNA (guanine527-N7)-methyltransferase
MISVDVIYTAFPQLSDHQKQQFERLFGLYETWNAQINVVSRKEFDLFYERHVLHSLGIAKMVDFLPGSKILDVGTGGGFPGIPLAILFPEVDFLLVDSIGKKIKVVNEVKEALGLTNVRAKHSRAEEVNEKFDFVVSRAVTQIDAFLPWVGDKFLKKSCHGFRNGIFYLKGGDLTEEFKSVKQPIQIVELKEFFKEDFFGTKKVVYIQMV